MMSVVSTRLGYKTHIRSGTANFDRIHFIIYSFAIIIHHVWNGLCVCVCASILLTKQRNWIHPKSNYFDCRYCIELLRNHHQEYRLFSWLIWLTYSQIFPSWTQTRIAFWNLKVSNATVPKSNKICS